MTLTTPVAIFSDHDVDSATDVTALVQAVIRFAPEGLQPRVYAIGAFEIDSPQYFITASWNSGPSARPDLRLRIPQMGRLAREVQAQQARVVHIATAGVMGLAGRWLARRFELPLTGSFQGPSTLSAARTTLPDRASDAYARWLYEPCAALFVPSHAVGASLVSAGHRADRLRLCARGVDAEGFHPALASTALRARWHVDHRRPAILCLSDPTGARCLSLLPAIERLLHRHCVAHQFVVVGEGRWRRELANTCPAAVVLETPTRRDLAVTMASADAALSVACMDRIGAGILEAQACGLPVVVPDGGDAHEAMRPDETGLKCRADDPDSMASALIALLTRPKRRQEMGSAARAYVVGRRRWDDAVEPLITSWLEAGTRGESRYLTADVTPASSGHDVAL
jgi:glycosyltransferase involved in cell wall biosynthesis